VTRLLERVVPVEIVRPRKTPLEYLVAYAATLLVRTWVVMLGVGAFFPELGAGFWQVMLALVVLGSAGILHAPHYLDWTRARETLR
jgi:hypothetical protein